MNKLGNFHYNCLPPVTVRFGYAGQLVILSSDEVWLALRPQKEHPPSRDVRSGSFGELIVLHSMSRRPLRLGDNGEDTESNLSYR